MFIYFFSHKNVNHIHSSINQKAFKTAGWQAKFNYCYYYFFFSEGSYFKLVAPTLGILEYVMSDVL